MIVDFRHSNAITILDVGNDCQLYRPSDVLEHLARPNRNPLRRRKQAMAEHAHNTPGGGSLPVQLIDLVSHPDGDPVAADIANIDRLLRSRWPSLAFVDAVNAQLPCQHPRLSEQEIEPWWRHGLLPEEALVAAYGTRRLGGRQ
jgi:hypothetical protein